MPSTKYTYSIVGDFPNAKVAPDRLAQEIRASAIITAFDYVGTSGDDADVWFKAALSLEDVGILDSLVASHSGEALADLPPSVSIAGIAVVDNSLSTNMRPRSGTKLQLVSQNFCDDHTWYSTSQRHTGISMTDSGNGLLWTIPNGTLTHCPPGSSAPFGLVDVTHGRILHERRLRDTYRTRVYVDGVEKTEIDPHSGNGDWAVAEDTGAVTFTADQSGKSVTIDFSEVVNSKWYIRPLPGKKLRIVSAELQFSTDTEMNDTFVFQARGEVDKFKPLVDYFAGLGSNPYPPGTAIPVGEPTCYQTVFDLICEANLSYPVIPKIARASPTWRDLKSDCMIFSWEYGDQATVDISSAAGEDVNDIEICLEHNIKVTGSYAVVTFYALSEDV